MQNNKFSLPISIFQHPVGSKIVQLTSALLAGYFYAGGFPDAQGRAFAGGTLLAVLSFFGFESSWQRPQFKMDLLRWLLFFLSVNYFGYQWVAYTLVEFGQLSGWLSSLVAVLFCLIIFPQYYPYILFKRCYLLLPQGLRERWYAGFTPSLRPWFLALFFILCEELVPQQFPAHPGHAWLSLAPRLGLAPLIGVTGLSFLTYLLAFSIIESIRHRVIPKFNFALVGVMASINFLLPLPAPLHSQGGLKVRVVQANIGNMVKLQAERGYREAVDSVLSNYEALSLDGPAPDLVIWPETAYPQFIYGNNPQEIKKSHSRLTRFLNNLQAPLIFGGYIERPPIPGQSFSDFEDVYNSAIYVNRNFEVVAAYHKQVLIPFGETLPFPRPMNLFLSRYLPAVSFFARGQGPVAFDLPKNFQALGLICYEVLFSSFVRNQLQTINQVPDFFVNLTNDSWYGPTAELQQHKFLAHWRALEFQVPIIRSTNTGITSILWPDGSESEQLKWDQLRALNVVMPARPNRAPSFYQRWGNFPLLLVTLLVLTYAFYNWRKSS